MVKVISKSNMATETADNKEDTKKRIKNPIKHMITDENKSAEHTVTEEQMKQVRNDIETSEPQLIIDGLVSEDARQKLWDYISKHHQQVTKGNRENIEHIVREIVGTGVIEEIIKDESITDIGYNGRHLVIESNDDKWIHQSNEPLDKTYVERVIQKFANLNGKEFTNKNPLFDGSHKNIRVSATHSANTSHGQPTMSLRMVYPKLALQQNNFDKFAPMELLDLFEILIKLKSNILISGETGTGKTELQKLLTSFIPFEERIILIEDVAETHLYELFPDKDIYPWITSETVGITPLVKKGLRDNPTWMFVTETRGGEAYEMIQAVLSSHYILTSLHAINAEAIPSRLISMSKAGGYHFSEENLRDDILRYFHFGVHIERARHDKKMYRYLKEIIAFSPEGNHKIFEQKFVGGEYRSKYYGLPEDLKEKIEDFKMGLVKLKEQNPSSITDSDENIMRFDWPSGEEMWRTADENGYIVTIPVVDDTPKELASKSEAEDGTNEWLVDGELSDLDFEFAIDDPWPMISEPIKTNNDGGIANENSIEADEEIRNKEEEST